MRHSQAHSLAKAKPQRNLKRFAAMAA